MKLVGYFNSTWEFPSLVVPILLTTDNSLVAAYRKSKPALISLDPEVAYERFDNSKADNLAGFDAQKHGLFAYSKSDIEMFPIDEEAAFLENLFDSPRMSASNSFSTLTLALRSKNRKIAKGIFRNCVREMYSDYPKFADGWYRVIKNKYEEFRQLPEDIHGFFESMVAVKIGCLPEKMGILSALCNYINLIERFNEDEKILHLWPVKADREELDFPRPFENYDIIWPDPLDWTGEDSSQDFIEEKPMGSSSIILAMNPAMLDLFESPKPDWNDVIRMIINNPEFKWNRPRSGTPLGDIIDCFLLENVEKIIPKNMEYLNETNVLGTLGRKVKRYFNSDMQIARESIRDGYWTVATFVGQKYVIDFVSKELPDNLKPVLINLPDINFGINHALYFKKHDSISSWVIDKFLDTSRTYDGELLMKDFGFSSEAAKILSEEVRASVYAKMHVLQRPLAVNMVIDASGSMEGEKIQLAKIAMGAFLGLMDGERGDSIGVVQFNNLALTLVPMDRLSNVENKVASSIAAISPRGGTALIDAVVLALNSFESKEGAINAVILLTDGHENSSQVSLEEMMRIIERAKNDRILIFGFAYGEDADSRFLDLICNASGGISFKGSTGNIKMLYQKVATLL